MPGKKGTVIGRGATKGILTFNRKNGRKIDSLTIRTGYHQGEVAAGTDGKEEKKMGGGGLEGCVCNVSSSEKAITNLKNSESQDLRESRMLGFLTTSWRKKREEKTCKHRPTNEAL